MRRFFGQAINYRKSIFLADANALVIPQDQLVPILDIIRSEFAIVPKNLDRPAYVEWRSAHPVHFRGVYSFVDAFTTRRKSAADFVTLAERGLRRIYVGLESGDSELLQFLGKPNSPDDAVRLAKTAKAGGVAVGVIILVGAGGEKHAANHVRHSVEAIKAMSLDDQDVIYLSQLVDYPGSSYANLEREAGIQPFSIEEIDKQMQDMLKLLRANAGGRGPKVSYYDVREFVY